MRVLPSVPARAAAHASCHARARRARVRSAPDATLERTYLRVGQQGKLASAEEGSGERMGIQAQHERGHSEHALAACARGALHERTVAAVQLFSL